MIIYLREKAKAIAVERKIEWHSGIDRKFWDLENSLKKGKITKDEAVEEAANILKIEKSYEPHYKKLEDSIKE